MTDNLSGLLRLMLVTDDALVADRDIVALARAAEHGGVTSIQLRLKHPGAREIAAIARAIIAAVGIPVLIDDRPDIALVTGAAGVHLGPDDVSVEVARRILPPSMIIGASVGLQSEIDRARGADYWGVGPWRATGTKSDAGAALGVEGFRRIAASSAGKPCIAIGGIRSSDVAEVLSAGAAGVAVVSGILGAENVQEAAREYRRALESRVVA